MIILPATLEKMVAAYIMIVQVNVVVARSLMNVVNVEGMVLPVLILQQIYFSLSMLKVLQIINILKYTMHQMQM